MTHYQRLLNYIVPDFVHVLSNGRIVKSGGKELALELEARGYEWVDAAATAVGSRRVSEAVAAGSRARGRRGDRRGPRVAGAAPPGRGGALRGGRLPGARDEEWRFTPVAPIASVAGVRPPASPPALRLEQLAPFIFGHPEWSTLVFVDGAYSDALSRRARAAAGVRAGSLAEAASRRTAACCRII